MTKLAYQLHDYGFNVITGEKETKRPYIPLGTKNPYLWELYQKNRLIKDRVKQSIESIKNENKDFLIGIIPGKITEGKYKGFYSWGMDFDDPKNIEICDITPEKCKENGVWFEPTKKGYHMYGISETPIESEKRTDLKVELFGNNSFIIIYNNFEHELYDLKPINVKNNWQSVKRKISKHKGIKSKEKTPVDELKRGVGFGSRNISAFKLVCQYRDGGLSVEEATHLMMRWNRKNKPPMHDGELLTTIKSAYKRPVKEKKEDLVGLSKKSFFIDDKFKAPLMGGHIVFNGFDINNPTGGVNKGFLVLKDTKEIWKYNSKYWDNNGEEIARDIMQRKLGISCCDKHKKESVNWIKDCGILHTDRELLDGEIKYIGMENGVYNTETKQLEEHMPSHMITSIIPVNYDPDADCPLWKKFLSEVTHTEDVNFIQEFVGYCFYRKIPWAIFVILLGHGRNGKTVFVKTITDMIGKKNVEHLPLHKLAYDDFARVRLYRKWANLCSDIDTHEIKKTGALKQLTGGDPMFARGLYQDGFNFVNIAKLLFACNELPLCTDKTFAMEERFAVIEFPNEFPRNDPNCDPFLYEKLITELPGIFNWAIKGLNRLLKKGTFSEYKSIENIRQYLSDTKNAVYKFIEKHITIDVGYEEVKDTVYQRFLQFAHDNKFSPIASNHFSSQFKKYAMFYFRETDKSFMLSEGQSRKKKGKTWKGIRLIEIIGQDQILFKTNIKTDKESVNDVND